MAPIVEAPARPVGSARGWRPSSRPPARLAGARASDSSSAGRWSARARQRRHPPERQRQGRAAPVVEAPARPRWSARGWRPSSRPQLSPARSARVGQRQRGPVEHARKAAAAPTGTAAPGPRGAHRRGPQLGLAGSARGWRPSSRPSSAPLERARMAPFVEAPSSACWSARVGQQQRGPVERASKAAAAPSGTAAPGPRGARRRGPSSAPLERARMAPFVEAPAQPRKERARRTAAARAGGAREEGSGGTHRNGGARAARRPSSRPPARPGWKRARMAPFVEAQLGPAGAREDGALRRGPQLGLLERARRTAAARAGGAREQGSGGALRNGSARAARRPSSRPQLGPAGAREDGALRRGPSSAPQGARASDSGSAGRWSTRGRQRRHPPERRRQGRAAPIVEAPSSAWLGAREDGALRRGPSSARWSARARQRRHPPERQRQGRAAPFVEAPARPRWSARGWRPSSRPQLGPAGARASDSGSAGWWSARKAAAAPTGTAAPGPRGALRRGPARPRWSARGRQRRRPPERQRQGRAALIVEAAQLGPAGAREDGALRRGPQLGPLECASKAAAAPTGTAAPAPRGAHR